MAVIFKCINYRNIKKIDVFNISTLSVPLNEIWFLVLYNIIQAVLNSSDFEE